MDQRPPYGFYDALHVHTGSLKNQHFQSTIFVRNTEYSVYDFVNVDNSCITMLAAVNVLLCHSVRVHLFTVGPTR